MTHVVVDIQRRGRLAKVVDDDRAMQKLVQPMPCGQVHASREVPVKTTPSRAPRAQLIRSLAPLAAPRTHDPAATPSNTKLEKFIAVELITGSSASRRTSSQTGGGTRAWTT